MAYYRNFEDQSGSPNGLTYSDSPWDTSAAPVYGLVPGTHSINYDDSGGSWITGIPNNVGFTYAPTGDWRRVGSGARIEWKDPNNQWQAWNSTVNNMTDMNSFWNAVADPGRAEFKSLTGNALGDVGGFDTSDPQAVQVLIDRLKASTVNAPVNDFYGMDIGVPGFNAAAFNTANSPESLLKSNSVSLKDAEGNTTALFIPSRLFNGVTYGNAYANETFGLPGIQDQLNEIGFRGTMPGLGEGYYVDPSKITGLKSTMVSRNYDTRDNSVLGNIDWGMLGAFAGIGGLGLSGLLEGLGGATAASAPAAEGLSWLGNAGLSSIPEAVASLPAAASAGAGASWLGNDGLSSIADAVGAFDPAAASGALETGAGTGIDIAADAAANVDPVWGQNLTPSDWTNYYDDWGVGTNAAGDIVNAQGQRAWQDVMAETLRDIGLPRDMAAKAVTSLSSLSPTDLKKALSAVTGGSGSGASGANSSATAGGVSGLLPIPIGQNKSIIEAMMSGGNNNSLDAFLAYMAQSGKGR